MEHELDDDLLLYTFIKRSIIIISLLRRCVDFFSLSLPDPVFFFFFSYYSKLLMHNFSSLITIVAQSHFGVFFFSADFSLYVTCHGLFFYVAH